MRSYVLFDLSWTVLFNIIACYVIAKEYLCSMYLTIKNQKSIKQNHIIYLIYKLYLLFFKIEINKLLFKTVFIIVHQYTLKSD